MDEICEAIPHADLAVQWDVSTEMGQWEGVRHAHFPDVKAGVIERLALHCNRVPRDVELGVHLCYGSYGGRDLKGPPRTAKKGEVHNPPLPSPRPPPGLTSIPVPPD